MSYQRLNQTDPAMATSDNMTTKERSIIDLQEKIENWADKLFLDEADRKMKKLFEKGHISREIDWSRVTITHSEPDYNPQPPKLGSGEPMSTVLFRTTFTNKTAKPHKYTFKTERSTRSSCVVTMENCYTKSGSVGIHLKTPGEIFAANVGFSRELSITNTNEQAIEGEMTWGVDSEIEVEGNNRAEAELVIREEQFAARFTVKTTMQGKVRVIYNNLKDNNSFITSIGGPIHKIIDAAIKANRIRGNSIVVQGDSVICTSTGQCTFRYGLKQDIVVEQFKIEVASPDANQ